MTPQDLAFTTYLPVEACELHHRYLRATLSAEKCQQTVSKIVKNRKIVKKAWNENIFLAKINEESYISFNEKKWNEIVKV